MLFQTLLAQTVILGFPLNSTNVRTEVKHLSCITTTSSSRKSNPDSLVSYQTIFNSRSHTWIRSLYMIDTRDKCREPDNAQNQSSGLMSRLLIFVFIFLCKAFTTTTYLFRNHKKVLWILYFKGAPNAQC